MVVVGCQSLTDGAPAVDAGDASSYRASVSTSMLRSSSASASRESERQASVTTKAVHSSCEALSITSVNAVDAVNAFVFAFNENAPAPERDQKAGAAVDALNASADEVSASLSEPLSDELEGLLREWVDAAREVAGVISRESTMEEFNAAADRLNDVKGRALALCDASY